MKIKKFIEKVQFIAKENTIFLNITGWAINLQNKKAVDIIVYHNDKIVPVTLKRSKRQDVVDELHIKVTDTELGFDLFIPIEQDNIGSIVVVATQNGNERTIVQLTHKQLNQAYKQQSQLYLHIDTIIAYEKVYYFKGWGGDNLFKTPLQISLIQNNRFLPVESFNVISKTNHAITMNANNKLNDFGFEFVIDKQYMTLDDPIIITGKNKYNREKMVTLTAKEMLEKPRLNVYLDELYTVPLDDENTEQFTLMCNGWAILENNGPVHITLVDSVGNTIPTKVTKSSRPDLKTQELLSPYDMGIGFALQADLQLNENYKLIVSNDSAIEVKSISHNFIQNFNKTTPLQQFSKMAKRINRENAKLALSYYKMYGFKQTFSKAKQVLLNGGHRINYMQWYEQHKADDKALDKQRQMIFEYSPKISIVVPTYRTPERYLREMIDSVIDQTYENWELCIADGSQDDNIVSTILQEYASQDERIKYVVLDENLGIAGNTNACLSLATGDYIGLFDHDDLLTQDALFEIVSSLQTIQYDAIYTDEDKVDETSTKFSGPHFKPKYSPDLLRSLNYITHFFVVKKEIVDKVGGFDKTFDGAQDFDFILRCTEVATSIHHIGKVLYHWRMHSNSTASNPESKLYAYQAGVKAIESHLKRLGIKGSVKQLGYTGYQTTYDVVGDPKVSILIPSKDHTKTLDKCIQSILKQHYFTNYEIIIIENNSEKEETFTYYKYIQQQDKRIKVVVWDGIFNYSAINNFGATFATGDYLLLLNNDTEMLEPTALRDMVGTVIQDGVGVVGAKLLFEDKTIQHAGVILGIDNVPTHILSGVPDKDKSYRHNALTNYLAVTAACLLTPKKVFDEVGGLSEEFVVAFNDIDYCLKVYQAGYRIVNNGFSKWLHYESKSRGYETTPQKQKRFLNEKNLFKEKWDNVFIDGDPYYNHELPH